MSTGAGNMDIKAAKGKVRLMNAVFYAHHGVMQEEHRIGGRYEVDVTMSIDFMQAARSDALADTVDYAEVYVVIKELVMKNKFYLIEKLAYLIATSILKSFAQVDDVEVTVRKVNPPVGGTCDRAEAMFTASRK